MKRRFVIGIDALDAGQEEKFRKYIARQGAWWNWIGNMWLMITDKEETSVTAIRDFIYELNPRARIIVFEIPEDITWAATSVENSSGRKLTDWLRTTWAGQE
jgi:hypothetical protein